MRVLFLIVLAAFLSGCENGEFLNREFTPAAWVDPFIGVEIGNTLPGAALPFGMVRLSPDVAPPNHTTGYRSDRPIRGFSHNHLSGTGGGARSEDVNSGMKSSLRGGAVALPLPPTGPRTVVVFPLPPTGVRVVVLFRPVEGAPQPLEVSSDFVKPFHYQFFLKKIPFSY